MKKFIVSVQCLATYTSSIDVPDDMTREEALEYARAHIDEIPIKSSLEHVGDSDELDEENCDFGVGDSNRS